MMVRRAFCPLPYDDYDARESIHILNLSSTDCQWFDNPAVLSLQEMRWYSAAEALADGTIVLIGGFTSGGYVNRYMPNTNPTYEGGGVTPTFEFYPSRGPATVMQFMTTTSGLNHLSHIVWPVARPCPPCVRNLTLHDYVISLRSGSKRRDPPRYAQWCHPCIPCFGRGRDASTHPSQQLYPHRPLLWWFRHARRFLRKLLLAILQHMDVPSICRLPASHARTYGWVFAGIRTGRRHARGPHYGSVHYPPRRDHARHQRCFEQDRWVR